MYELVPANGNTFYIQSPAKIGLVRVNDGEAVLIDSGSDKDAGRKALKLLEAQGLTLTAIFNTHSHADHIGGNRFLQERTGCRVFAPGIEAAFTRHTLLEPALLYGGCPPKALRHKFLMAQESEVLPLAAASLPEGLSAIPLPGHAPEMAGFRTADDVVFLADSLSSRETLDKYGVGYVFDVGEYLKTLETVKNMQARLFVPAHAAPTEDIAPLARYNIDKTLEIADRIAAFCTEPKDFDTLLQQLFRAYGLTMTVEQHALVGSTVKSYLTWLQETGRVEMRIENDRLLWARI